MAYTFRKHTTHILQRPHTQAAHRLCSRASKTARTFSTVRLLFAHNRSFAACRPLRTSGVAHRADYNTRYAPFDALRPLSMHDGYAAFTPCSSMTPTATTATAATMPRRNGHLRSHGIETAFQQQPMVQHEPEQVFVPPTASVAHQNLEERRRSSRNGIVIVNGNGGGGNGGGAHVDLMSISLPNVEDVFEGTKTAAALEPSKSLSGGDFAKRVGG